MIFFYQLTDTHTKMETCFFASRSTHHQGNYSGSLAGCKSGEYDIVIVGQRPQQRRRQWWRRKVKSMCATKRIVKRSADDELKMQSNQGGQIMLQHEGASEIAMMRLTDSGCTSGQTYAPPSVFVSLNRRHWARYAQIANDYNCSTTHRLRSGVRAIGRCKIFQSLFDDA